MIILISLQHLQPPLKPSGPLVEQNEDDNLDDQLAKEILVDYFHGAAQFWLGGGQVAIEPLLGFVFLGGSTMTIPGPLALCFLDNISIR